VQHFREIGFGNRLIDVKVDFMQRYFRFAGGNDSFQLKRKIQLFSRSHFFVVADYRVVIGHLHQVLSSAASHQKGCFLKALNPACRTD